MSEERYAFSPEEGFFVDMHNPDPDDPELGEELLVQDVLLLLNRLHGPEACDLCDDQAEYRQCQRCMNDKFVGSHTDEEWRKLEDDLRIEKRKHVDTSNWALEQQERADTAENKIRKLEAVVEATKRIDFDALVMASIELPQTAQPRAVHIRRLVSELSSALADLEDGK